LITTHNKHIQLQLIIIHNHYNKAIQLQLIIIHNHYNKLFNTQLNKFINKLGLLQFIKNQLNNGPHKLIHNNHGNSQFQHIHQQQLQHHMIYIIHKMLINYTIHSEDNNYRTQFQPLQLLKQIIINLHIIMTIKIIQVLINN